MISRQSLLKVNRALLRNGPRALGSQTQFLRATSTAFNNQKSKSRRDAEAIGLAALAGAFAAGSVALADSGFWHPDKVKVTIDKSASKFYSIEADNKPPPRPDLPTMKLEDVAEHNDEESMWFTFRGAVYDMTFFQNGHPGGAPVSINS
jgi:cytochrome b involved in lipid metabolism